MERSVRKFMQRGQIFCKGWTSVIGRKSQRSLGGGPGGVWGALRDRVDVAEAESASLRAMIRTMVAVEMVLRNRMRDERQTCIEIEHQLASVQESHRQDQEDFKKLKEFMTKNYVPWSSRLLRYAKSRPNGKLIHNSILNGPYIEAGDQAIQTILLGLPEDIYDAVDSCETAQEIWL
nr:hypothetical protein [Tanacetum cinerariifolium]